MKYLSTKMATDWQKKKPSKLNITNLILFFIPNANPGYDSKMHLVKKWFIEFKYVDEELLPWREIALDENDNPVFAGPDKQNYGFWLDTYMKYEDFKGEPLSKNKFEEVWKITGVNELKI